MLTTKNLEFAALKIKQGDVNVSLQILLILDLTEFLLKIKQIDSQSSGKKEEKDEKSEEVPTTSEKKEKDDDPYGEEFGDDYGGDFGLDDYGDDFGLDGSFCGDDFYPEDLGDKNILPGQSPLHVPEEQKLLS